MNTLRNKVQLIGNLGNDPEIITLDSGKKLAKFSLATNEHYKDADGQKQTKTDWHNLVAWNKTAEIIENYEMLPSRAGTRATPCAARNLPKQPPSPSATLLIVKEKCQSRVGRCMDKQSPAER